MTNIIQFPVPIPVMNGNLPQFKFAIFGDNLAAVTTAGYLNSAAIQAGIPISNSDVIQCLYSYNQQTGSGTYGVFTVSISTSTGNITLSEWTGTSGVTLPTIANHIATYTNTTGNISEDPATAISGGNIQAGLSGTAGTVASFPATGSKGSLILAGVANTGNTNTTISNAAMGQASVVSIPDPGAATANFIISASAGTQHITTGAFEVDAGVISSGISTGGTAGGFIAYPATASNGSLRVTPVGNAGNFAATISNVSTLGQASVYTIPDPAGATANIAVAPAALVNNNLIKASGTAGLIADSGISSTSISGAITQLGQLYQVSVTFNTASMVTAYDTPLTIVANPLASQMILLLQATVYTASTGNTPYATGTAPIIQYSTGGTNGQHGTGTIATAAGLVAGDITAAASQVRNLFGIATAALTGLSGKGIYFSNATGDYTAGTGTSVTFTLVYQLLTATV